MSTQTVTLYDKALKEVYYGPIRDQLNRCSVVHDMLKKNSEDVGGKYAVIPVLVAGNNGTGSRAETAQLPTAGYQDVQSARVPLKYHYGRIQISDVVMEASATSKQAFKSALVTETDGLVSDMKDMIGRQIFNDGTPTLAVIAAGDATTGTTITFDTGRSSRIFKNGQTVDFVLAAQTAFVASGTNTVGIVIGNVAYTNTAKTAGTFTVTTGFTRTAGDRIVMTASMTPGATPVYYEMQGLSGAIGGNGSVGLTTYLNLSGSTYAAWQSSVIDASGSMFVDATLGDDQMQAACDSSEIESGSMLDCFVTTYDSRKRFVRGLQADRRFADGTYEAGWKAIGFQSGGGMLPVYVDKWCTPATAYGMTKKFWEVYRLTDFSWMDRGGAVLIPVADYPIYSATMRYYAELGCSKRNANARIINLTE